MSDSLPDKPSRARDEITRAIRTGLRLIPYGIGGALDVQIFDRMAARDHERLRSFVESLGQEVDRLAGEHPDFVKLEFFDTDEFRFILREVLTGAAREHREEKINAYRAALINSMGTDPRIDFDRKAFFLGVLDSLTVDQLSLLRFLHSQHQDDQPPIELGEIFFTFKPTDDVAEDYIRSGVETLVRHQLAKTRPLQLPSVMYGGDGVDARNLDDRKQRYKIGPLGIEFIKFVSIQADRSGNATTPMESP